MKKKSDISGIPSIRQMAEEFVKNRTSVNDMEISDYEVRKLIHELEVHQIELELQNEELVLARYSAQESADKYAELYDFSPSGYFTLSREGIILNSNFMGAKLLGKDLFYIKDKNLIVFVSDNTKQFFTLFLRKVFNSKFKESCELCILSEDRLPVYVYLTGIVSGNDEQCLVNMIDITERRKAEEEILIFKSIFERSEEAIALCSVEGWMVYINSAFERLFNRSFEEVLTMNYHDFFPMESANYFNNVIFPLLESGKSWEGELDAINSSRVRFPLWERVGVIPDDNGKILYYFGIMHDNSHHKKEEEKLRNLNEQLEKRVVKRTEQLEQYNKELESFSYSVSHDLRAPVRHINGFADILKNDYYEQLPDEARHYLDTIISSAKRMGDLIDDLLSFSRTGREELIKSSFPMNKVVKEALIQINPFIEYRKVDMNVSELPEAYADYNLLRQVWINLLDNAAKYTRTKERAVIEIGFKEEDLEVVYYIKDNGVGFDMKYSHKLFGVFQRLHSPAQFDGTGIGLANVRRIITRHGGRTWAEAEVDKGATFYFSMPKQ